MATDTDTTERPPLTAAAADSLNQALDKAYAVSMLLSMADDNLGRASDAAMVILDYLDAARAELATLQGVHHG